MLQELVANAMHSSTAGFVGVTLIVAYFVLIFCTACDRIVKGEHMGH